MSLADQYSEIDRLNEINRLNVQITELKLQLDTTRQERDSLNEALAKERERFFNLLTGSKAGFKGLLLSIVFGYKKLKRVHK